jgi:hypothetical protein
MGTNMNIVRKATMKRLLLGLPLVVALLSACDATAPDNLEYSFTSREIDAVDMENPAVTARAEGLRILVRGETWTTCQGGVITGDVTKPSRDVLTVVVSELRTTIDCVPATVPYEYNAIIGPLNNGRYQVTVLHSHAASPNEVRTVLSRTVDIN